VTLGALWFDLQGAAAGLERVFFLMEPAVRARRGGRPSASGVAPRHSLRSRRLPLPDGTRALADVSFEARVGELTAVVGPAGSGRPRSHTCARASSLRPKVASPSTGSTPRECTIESLRKSIAYVFQETFLFDGTIEDNLRLVAPDASEAQLLRALEVARATEFVLRCPTACARASAAAARSSRWASASASRSRARWCARRKC